MLIIIYFIVPNRRCWGNRDWFINIDQTIIDACPNLKLVHQTGIGVDNVDVIYCTWKSIYVANVPLANAVSVAEHTLFLILYLAKNLKGISSSTTSASLLERRVAGILGSEVQGKSLTIIGLGAMGLEVAKRAKSFGMQVVAVTKNPFLKKPGTEKVYFVDNLGGPEILSECIAHADYVSLHTPPTEQTRNMIGTKELGLMKNQHSWQMLPGRL
jgi:D-3-phosphoglycerate dehydrogenase